MATFLAEKMFLFFICYFIYLFLFVPSQFLIFKFLSFGNDNHCCRRRHHHHHLIKELNLSNCSAAGSLSFWSN